MRNSIYYCVVHDPVGVPEEYQVRKAYHSHEEITENIQDAEEEVPKKNENIIMLIWRLISDYMASRTKLRTEAAKAKAKMNAKAAKAKAKARAEAQEAERLKIEAEKAKSVESKKTLAGILEILGGKSKGDLNKFLNNQTKIINKYGAVIEATSHMVFGAPDNLLPYGKDTIKEAIKFQLLMDNIGDEKIDRVERAVLIMGYTKLAHFIPIDDFRSIQDAYGPGKLTPEEALISENKEKYLNILNSMISEGKKLERELSGILRK